MKKPLLFVLFIALSITQLAVPTSMIFSFKKTLEYGQLFKFRTAPFRVGDICFAGPFLELNLEPGTAPLPEGEHSEPKQRTYALLREDEDGFVKIKALSFTRPDDGAYVTTKIESISGRNAELHWPIDRYYMGEELELKALDVFDRWNKPAEFYDQVRKGYATVRVRRGKAVLEKLYIEDIPFAEYMRQLIAEEDNAPTTQ